MAGYGGGAGGYSVREFEYAAGGEEEEEGEVGGQLGTLGGIGGLGGWVGFLADDTDACRER